jgi:hypothetical protein
MRLASSLALWLAAGSALVMSCTGLNAADQMEDPAGTGASGFAPGTVGGQCTPNADGCQWQANECESDPVCAHWYACVLSKPLDANVQKAIASCQSTALSATQKKLLACLYSSPSCANADPTPGSAGAGGTEKNPESGVDGGDLGPGDVDSGASTYNPNCANQAPGPVATTECAGCIINNCCDPVKDPSNKCYAIKHTSACWLELPFEWQMENCLYNAQLPEGPYEFTSAAHEALVGLGVMSCFLTTCSEACSPPDGRCCMQCQQANCKGQLATFMGSAAAQDYQWCLTHCDWGNEGKPVENYSECRAKCDTDYPDGIVIVSALVGCKFDQCPVCNELP